MQINYFHWIKMSEAEKQQIFGRNQHDLSSFIEAVRPIVDDVRERGDQALVDYEAKFNQVTLKPDQLLVTQAEIKKAVDEVDADVHKTLEACIENVEAHNKAALKAYAGGFMNDRRYHCVAAAQHKNTECDGLNVMGWIL